jgi:hypothetical protein
MFAIVLILVVVTVTARLVTVVRPVAQPAPLAQSRDRRALGSPVSRRLTCRAWLG